MICYFKATNQESEIVCCDKLTFWKLEDSKISLMQRRYLCAVCENHNTSVKNDEWMKISEPEFKLLKIKDFKIYES